MSGPDRPPPRVTAQNARVVALTGASSFLGKNLVDLLEADRGVRRVVAFDVAGARGADAAPGPKTVAVDVDLTAPTAGERLAEVLAAERVDTLVHLAFLAAPTPATAWAHELESVGTMHLLHALRLAQVRKLVAWSQTVLYGAHPQNPGFLAETSPLRADPDEPYFADKIAAERAISAYAAKARGAIVTVLRTAPILGPTVRNYVTAYFGRRSIPTLLGFDPLLQFVHEADALTAFKLAVERDVPGVFNVVAPGVLPLSHAIRIVGGRAVPLPHPMAEALGGPLWLAQLVAAPPTFLRYLRYVCVADGARAEAELGFRAAHGAREALEDFASARRMRAARVFGETGSAGLQGGMR